MYWEALVKEFLWQVLGSLVTHTGSGVDYEVSAALDALIVISSKHSEELLQMSSYINSQ